MPGLQYGTQPQQQYQQQLREYQQRCAPQEPYAPQRNSRKRRMGQAQSMVQIFEKHISNSTSASASRTQNQRSTPNTPPLQSTLVNTPVPVSSTEPSNVISSATNLLYAAPDSQTQGERSTEHTSPLRSTLTGVPLPSSCAEPSDAIPSGAMLPLLVEYAHLLSQKTVDSFGKVFRQMTVAEQQEIITNTEEEGIRGFAKQVAKHAIWQTIFSNSFPHCLRLVCQIHVITAISSSRVS